MFSNFMSALLVPALLFSSIVSAAGSGAQVDLTKVGPSTSLSQKSTVCNILNYGAVADNKTDVGPAILLAFSSCAIKGGATLYIPPGSYSLATGVTLNKGSNYAMQIDGLITLTATGSFGGNAFVIKGASDVEVFSSNGLGAINGQGYITRITASGQNARLFRFISCSNISFHDIILVDSPTFHLVFNDVSNMEAYHITIRGPNLGGTDGIDVICTDNCYMHHIEVTNRDECISVKSPSQNILIEEIFCNQSGGMSIGSLTADGVTSTTMAQVSNITMRNVYIYQCTQMLMIKTYPGGTGATGYVKNSLFENFWAYDTTYGLDIDQYWYSHTTPNTGAVAISDLTFNNWTGTVDNGISRAPIVIRGSDQVPLTDIELSNFIMWTVNQKRLEHQCKNVYGTGYCAATSTAGKALTTFTSTMTVTATPAGFTSPTSPAWGITGYGVTIPIPVYTPAAMWAASGSKVTIAVAVVDSSKAVSSTSSIKTTSPTTSLQVASSTSSVKSSTSTTSTSTSSKVTSTVTPSIKVATTSSSTLTTQTTTSTTMSPVATVVVAAQYSQCGGLGFSGTTICASPYNCTVSNAWYSQCL